MTAAVLRIGTLLALVAAACGNRDQGPVAGEEYENMGADQIIVNPNQIITADGIRQAVLRADTAFVYEDSAFVEFRAVELTLFERDGAEAAHLTADTGELETRTEAMVARGDVVLVTTEGGRRIETEELHYDPRQRRIWSDVPTVIIDAGDRLEGTGFTADLSTDGRIRDITLRDPRGRAPGSAIEF